MPVVHGEGAGGTVSPDHEGFTLSLARGRLDEARRFYKKALDRYGRHADTFAAMGTLELTAGDRVRAERWLSRAREIDPEAERVQSLENRLAATANNAQPQI